MDFFEEFQKCLKKFPSVEGLIFVDPSGEAILHEAPAMDDFDVKLTGARIPILMQHFQFIGIDAEPRFMELIYKRRYMLTVCLEQSYSITAIGKSVRDRGALKNHLYQIATLFNQEII